MQWAQRLTESEDRGVAASGFYLLDYLGTSDLAGVDDRHLLFRLTRTAAINDEAATLGDTVDASTYVVDDGQYEESEAGR